MADDQAQHLRSLIGENRASTPTGPRRGIARTFAVTGGKGGVGKTNIAVALAQCAARLGLRVALLDADFGLANIHVLLGLSPKADLRDVVSGSMRLADTLLEGPEGIMILPGGSGLPELANLDAGQRRILLAGLEEIADDFDLLVIDTSAGIAENILAFVAAADEAIIVSIPEPTALQDAYAVLKIVSARRPDLPFHLLMNNAASPGEAEAAAKRIAEVAARFLNKPVSYMGSVPADPAVGSAVRARKPFLTYAPESPAAIAFTRIAETLFAREIPPASKELPTFARRLGALFRLGARI